MFQRRAEHTHVIPGEQRRKPMRGKGTQAFDTVTVSPTWIPFPSRRDTALGRG
jgi:hypothetical protein